MITEMLYDVDMFDFMSDRAPGEDLTVEADPAPAADAPSFDAPMSRRFARPAPTQSAKITPLGPASPGALPRLRHQHRIIIGAAPPLPRPLTPGPG